MGPRIRNADGFTLVELVIVIAMMAIVAGLAIPRYAASVNHYRASAAARKLAGDFSFVQGRARAASTTCVISFSTITSSYQLLSEPDPVVAGAIYTVNLASAPYSTTISSVSFGGAGSVGFNAFGVPTGGGTVVLRSGDAVATVVLDGTTGVVSIQ